MGVRVYGDASAKETRPFRAPEKAPPGGSGGDCTREVYSGRDCGSAGSVRSYSDDRL